MEVTSGPAMREQAAVDELEEAAEAGLRLGLERWPDEAVRKLEG